MVLDIQTVHHILKNTAVQNVNKPFVYITDLTSTLRLLHTMNVRFSLLDIAQRILGVTLPNFQ